MSQSETRRGPRPILAGLALAAALSWTSSAQESDWTQQVVWSPGPVEPDVFHPDRGTPVEPRRGGRVIVHISSLPKHVNYMTENSATTRRMLREVHEFLLEQGWEDWKPTPVLARELPVVEDTLILAGGRGPDNSNILFGRVTEEGDSYVVTPLSKNNPLEGRRAVPKDQVESLERETVFTFTLRDGVKWHDGHPLDADDVVFSFQQYLNPNVDCDNIRFKYQKFTGVEKIDDLTVRFYYSQQYFLALDSFYDLVILPSHLYNLRDPDNPDYDPEATDAAQGTYINENRHNNEWVGLGPYRITEWTNQHVDAVRFDDYFDPEHSGWVDEIRWRHIPNDESAKTALINGELDYWERLETKDYFGAFTKQPAFTEHFYKGLMSYPYMGYTTYNMRRPKFADPAVRRALSMSFDWDEWIKAQYYGLAVRVTGSQYYGGASYDHDLEPIPFDLDAAEELLFEAGWYDRDGDDIIDKDGQPFVVEFLMPTGNNASTRFGEKWQENLARLGIKMNIATRDWAVFLERLYDRDYDCANLAWIQDLYSDPEQLWHSKWAVTPRSSNHCGLADPEVDRLIEAIQVELDENKRNELFHKMQARIYELQPYMFGVNQPKKFVASRRIRNLKTYAPDPGYRIREWFLVDGGGGDSRQ